MAKKTEDTQPVVTRLNLPISEESLMVDLPDGQKLVIGKMATGSVIEVATWRGTGRPDSRTTRMMLGMSGNADEALPEGQAPGQTSTTPPASRKDAALSFIKAQFVKQDKPKATPAPVKSEPQVPIASNENSEPSRLASFKSLKLPKLDVVKKADFTARPESKNVSSSDFDIDAWLSEIKAKSSKKIEAEKTSKQVVKPAAAKKPVAKKAVAKKSAPKSSPKSKGRGR